MEGSTKADSGSFEDRRASQEARDKVPPEAKAKCEIIVQFLTFSRGKFEI